MNRDAIGAIGQMLGSVAVFVTLAYLAVQVRHSRQDARRALSQSRGETRRSNGSAFRRSTRAQRHPEVFGI